MDQNNASYKTPMEREELAYLVSKKEADVAKQARGFRALALVIAGISVAVGVVMFALTRLWPATFVNANEPPPNVLIVSLKLMLGLLCAVVIAGFYSYARTTGKLAKDIKSGQKTVDPCIVIRKLYSHENNTCHVYITLNVRLSIEVTPEEYNRLHEGDRVYIEYSTLSKIFFGYFIK